MNLESPPPEILVEGSVFLDFDGTLVELGPTRDELVVPKELPQLLTRLNSRLSGRLALLSGRSAPDIRSRLRLGNIRIAGATRAPRNQPSLGGAPKRSLGMSVAERELRRFEAEVPGVTVEERPATLAIHYRRAPNAEATCRKLAQRLATATGMVVHYGKTFVELKARSTHKGNSVRRLMRQLPFRNSRPVVIADDVTYEHAFVVARDMGGWGVLVGPPRRTAASYRLDNVEAVHDWLRSVGRNADD